MIVILTMSPPTVNGAGQHPLPPDIIEEFEGLLAQLDVYRIRRPSWDRVKTILAIATLEAGDTDKGTRAFTLAVAKWRMSRFFDGED